MMCDRCRHVQQQNELLLESISALQNMQPTQITFENADEFLRGQLAAANAELAAAVKKVEDFDLVVVMNKKLCSDLDAAKARVAAYKKALDIAMSTNQSHETYCKVEAALEEKP